MAVIRSSRACPGCRTSSAGLHRAARVSPAELTGRPREIGDGVSLLLAVPRNLAISVLRLAGRRIAAACATDSVGVLVPAPVDAPVLAQSAGAAGRHGDAACTPCQNGRAASRPDSAEKARREQELALLP